MDGARFMDHRGANLNSDSMTWLKGVQQKAGLAADVQQALARINQVPKQADEQFVIVAIFLNPASPCMGDGRLMFPIPLISKPESFRTPSASVRNAGILFTVRLSGGRNLAAHRAAPSGSDTFSSTTSIREARLGNRE